MTCGLVIALMGATAIDRRGAVPTAMNAQATINGSAPAARQQGIARAADGLFYVEVHNGVGRADLLVDTGASHVVLSRADARRLGARLQSSAPTTIATAAGPVVAQWVVIDSLEVQGHVLRDVQAAVPQGDVGTSLLGQNALVQFSQIQIQGDRLSLSN